MMKRMVSLTAALVMACAGACADTWDGAVETAWSERIEAPADGTVGSLDLTVGQRVTAGDKVGAVEAAKVFSPADGTVVYVNGRAGDAVSGTEVELSAVSPYRIVCTVDEGAYQSAETTFVHAGETLYIKCTVDGTHRAVGRVTSISGSDYDVEALGGELYIGETVYLYRDADFTASRRVGIGTVVESDTLTVSADGTILSVSVAEGDTVQRGQLLFTYASSDSTDIVSGVSGIVTEISAKPGSTVTEGGAVASVTTEVRLTIGVELEDADRFKAGQTMYYTTAADDHTEGRTAVVTYVSSSAENGSVTVRLRPDDPGLPVGLSVTVMDTQD